jgi:hypothetical protein
MNQIVLLIPGEDGAPTYPVVLVPYLPPGWEEGNFGNISSISQEWFDLVLIPAAVEVGIDPVLVNEWWAPLGEVEE